VQVITTFWTSGILLLTSFSSCWRILILFSATRSSDYKLISKILSEADLWNTWTYGSLLELVELPALLLLLTNNLSISIESEMFSCLLDSCNCLFKSTLIWANNFVKQPNLFILNFLHSFSIILIVIVHFTEHFLDVMEWLYFFNSIRSSN